MAGPETSFCTHETNPFLALLPISVFLTYHTVTCSSEELSVRCLLRAGHCLHIRGFSSKLDMVLALEEQELNNSRLTQPGGVGQLESARESI